MSLHHGVYGALKAATFVFTALAAVLVVMDPTVKVAIIVAIPSAITGIGTLILGFLNRRDARVIQAHVSEIKASVNGNFTRLLDEKAKQRTELTDKTEKLAHAEGRREGVEASDKEGA